MNHRTPVTNITKTNNHHRQCRRQTCLTLMTNLSTTHLLPNSISKTGQTNKTNSNISRKTRTTTTCSTWSTSKATLTSKSSRSSRRFTLLNRTRIISRISPKKTSNTQQALSRWWALKAREKEMTKKASILLIMRSARRSKLKERRASSTWTSTATSTTRTPITWGPPTCRTCKK